MTTTIEAATIAIDQSECFEYSCREEAVFPVSQERAYEALFDLTQWQRLLPHILQLDVAYDDGRYQEFYMTVASEAEGQPPLTVRSVRNCGPNVIEFFQPVPPKFLRHHGGIWRFSQVGESTTHVEITHVWNLDEDVANEVFPSDADGTTQEKVHATLAGHSRITLQTWRTILEREAKG
ncbi:hypothetical protein HJ588_04320 [Flexivirga sp. ID2601S]|uniref:SRPBCC family protein n=1 Tax=Flexivirga aerilata TaxID=1656889 RepID=A0A849AJC0_9MICO|nr:hypothetical protein [Flexivirga aerilata]NNG38500.1 hypothetical protein [Flexivirga aerilata]